MGAQALVETLMGRVKIKMVEIRRRNQKKKLEEEEEEKEEEKKEK